MTHDRRDIGSFARAVEALEPYLNDLVFVGGWAHYLYTLRPEASPLTFEPLRTEDADVAAPARLARGRQTIAECLTKAGFREHLSGDHTPPISEYVLGDEATGFYLEFLAPLVGGELKRGGRRDVTTMVGGVTAQTLRHLDILLSAPWQVTLNRRGGFPVARPRGVSIPSPAAYIVQKMLVLPKRHPDKQAKDILYVHDTFAIFADSLASVKAAWGTLRKTMLAAHVRTFEKTVRSDVAEVSDLVRRAAKIASSRATPPTPEMLLLGLRQGFATAFDLSPAAWRK
jgi:hypothetical protein